MLALKILLVSYEFLDFLLEFLDLLFVAALYPFDLSQQLLVLLFYAFNNQVFGFNLEHLSADELSLFFVLRFNFIDFGGFGLDEAPGLLKGGGAIPGVRSVVYALLLLSFLALHDQLGLRLLISFVI